MAEDETIELDFEPMDEIATINESNLIDIADKLNLPDSSDDENEPHNEPQPVNELQIVSSGDKAISPRKRDRRAISPPEDNETEDLVFSSHLAGRVTRVLYKSYDKDESAPRKISRKDWGLETPSKDANLTNEDIARIYSSLDVDLDDNRIQLNTIIVRGTDNMNEYDIEKIFAEFEPVSPRPGMAIVRFMDEKKSECVLSFKDIYKVVEMFLNMSKELKRIRPVKKPEEGEVIDSEDDEEGQVREVNGEDVAVVQESSTKAKSSQLPNEVGDYFEVDIDKVAIPSGKWRVITKHVPGKRLIIAQFARYSDINKANRNPTNFRADRRTSDDRDDSDFAWNPTKNRVRPGLNIFDDKGKELEWDYEHDTRFYDEPNESGKKDETTSKDTDETLNLGGRVIHSKGRGAKKFVLKGSSSEDSD